MNIDGQYTREEIFSQPEAWAAALDELDNHRTALQTLWQAGRYEQVLFTGCGSTYYLALAAAALCQSLTHVTARALPASELWLSPATAYPAAGRILLVAISRSGETTETLHTCETFKVAKRGELLTLSCYAPMPLARLGDYNLVLPSGAERSVAQTRAFTTLYLATVWLAALWAQQLESVAQLGQLPAAVQTILEHAIPLVRPLAQDRTLDRFYFLGSGPRYGLACELSLKMKEMSLSHSEPFHFLEFRHGPKSMVTSTTLITGLVSSSLHSRETAVLQEMHGLGGRILNLNNEKGDLPFHSTVDEPLRDILYLPIGQLLAFERSLAKGLNPDRPHHLESVVRL